MVIKLMMTVSINIKIIIATIIKIIITMKQWPNITKLFYKLTELIDCIDK